MHAKFFMSTHLPLQILSFLVLLPATQATKYLGVPVLQQLIARMPWLLQFFLAIVVADIAEYFIHLALHKVPFLWRFHAQDQVENRGVVVSNQPVECGFRAGLQLGDQFRFVTAPREGAGPIGHAVPFWRRMQPETGGARGSCQERVSEIFSLKAVSKAISS